MSKIPWEIFEIFLSFIGMLLCYFFIFVLTYQKSRNFKRDISILFITSVLLREINIFLGQTSIIGCMAKLLFMVVIFCYMFNVNKIQMIFYNIVFFLISSIFDFISVIFTVTILKQKGIIILSHNGYRAFGGIISGILQFSLIIFLYKIKISEYFKFINKKAYLIRFIGILVIPFVLLIFSFQIYGEDQLSNNKIVLMALSLIIFSFIMMKLVFDAIKICRKEYMWRIKELEYKNYSEYINDLYSLTNKLKSQRHDFNHHIGCINGLIELGKYDEVKKYTNKIINNIEITNEIINIGNSYILAIINSKFTLMKQSNILFTHCIDVPEEIYIDSVDICVILGNALDNAIEACLKSDKKEINCSMRIKDEYLVIKIVNSKTESSILSTSNYITTKQDFENHGFGINNIRYLVDKYNGILKINETDNTFEINIALKMKKQVDD